MQLKWKTPLLQTLFTAFFPPLSPPLFPAPSLQGSVLFPAEEVLRPPLEGGPRGPNPVEPLTTPPSSTLSLTTLSSLHRNSSRCRQRRRGRSFRWRRIATEKRSSCNYSRRMWSGRRTFLSCCPWQRHAWQRHSASCLFLRKSRSVYEGPNCFPN